jgi:hypothetical protein
VDVRHTTAVQAAAPTTIEGQAPASLDVSIRGFADRSLAGAPGWLLAFAFVLGLGAADGGYWPTSWGWAALVLLVACAVALVARVDVRLGVLDAAAELRSAHGTEEELRRLDGRVRIEVVAGVSSYVEQLVTPLQLPARGELWVIARTVHPPRVEHRLKGLAVYRPHGQLRVHVLLQVAAHEIVADA